MNPEEILKSIGYDNDSITSTEKWIAKELYKKSQSQNKELIEKIKGLLKDIDEADHADYCMCRFCSPDFHELKTKKS